MRTRTPLITVAVLALALGAAACGSSSSGGSSSANAPQPNAPEQSPPGDIPDNQAFVRFTPAGAGYSVKVPEGWARSTAGGAVTFTDKLNSIRVEQAPAPVALTVRDARQTDIPKLAQSVKGFQAGKAASVARPAGQAIRITYLASAPPNSVTGKAGTEAVERYVFFHNGKELVVTLSGPKGADNVDPWKIVTDSVRWSA
jgi:hypothetical protein